MSAAIDDIEALFTDVGHVQKELEKFDIKKAVDANEIYELLETHSFRSDRVQFVTMRLLITLGVINDFDSGDIFNVSDDSDDYLEDLCYTSSPECSVCSDTVVLDLSVSDLHSSAESSVKENMNGNSNSSTGYAEALAASEVDVYPSTSLFQGKTKGTFQVHEIEPTASPAAGASKPESNVALSTTIEGTNTKCNSEPNNSNGVSPPVYQNDDFMCDVNNNDPNNNTEYEVPVQVEDKQEQHNFTAIEADDSGMEFEDQDDVRCKLLEEARLIHRIVPKQNLEQIYSYLEASVDHKNRVQIVMQEFLRMELGPEFCDSAISDNGSVGSRSEGPCQHSNSVPETHILSEPLPCTSSVRKIGTEKKNAVKTNVRPEPQPSTSSNSKMKTRALKRNTVRELCSPTSKNAKMNTKGSALNKQKGMTFEQDKVSKPHPSVGKFYRKAHNTSQVFENIKPGIDSEIGTISSATDPKLPSIWEVSSTSASSSSAEQNSGAIDNAGEVGITSTTNLNKQTKPADANNECALKRNTPDAARLGRNDEICVSELGTSQVGVHATVDTLIPSSSTVNMNPIASTSAGCRRKLESVDSESSPNKKNRSGDFDQSHSLTHIEVATNEITLTQNQLKYKSILMEMFPAADPQYLREQCQTVETEESMLNMVTKLLEGDDYPHRQTPEEVPIESGAGPSTSSSVPDEDRVEMQYDTLVAILPNADPMYLRETCEKIGNDDDAMKTFVTQALETKIYPTREDYLKRQEALALQKKYTEQFSIEGFLEILPDPFKYFLEEKRNDGKLTKHSLAYLKRRYKRIRNEELKDALFKNHYNLTLACQKLDNYKGALRRNRRSEYECRIPTEVNIPFLQEVAFIENKTKIESYLKDKADKKKRAFEEAKAKGDLLECGCCFDNEVMLEDMAPCNEGHLFCKECVRKGAEVQIGNGKTTFPCLTDCVAEFSLKTLQAVLKPSVLSMVFRRKQLEEVKAAGIEDLETCPFCDFASIPPHEDKVFRCLNPDCMRESCRNCKEPNHIPLRCDEVEKPDEVKVRTYIEDRMTEALVRTCWKCGKKFIKEDGCNKMTCTCGAIMCYICRQPVKDYSHFNGQGGDAHHKCPLYTHNDAIHVDAVRKEAKKAKKEMEAKNPEMKLKHDPTQILPEASLNRGHRQHHHHHHHHHYDAFPRPPVDFREPADGGLILMERMNRGRAHIQMAVRMLAGIVPAVEELE